MDIPALIADFTADHPNVDLGLREGTAERMFSMLRDGRLDLAFALEPEERPAGVSGVTLASEELALVAAVDHRLAARATVTIAALADERLIVFEPGSSSRALLDA